MKGFQIFFEAIKPQLQSQLDVIVSVIHFMLVSDDFLSVGVGEEFTPEDAKGGGELLPTGWNSNQTLYSLKYRSRNADNAQVLFKGIVAGDLFIASLLPLKSTNTVHSVSLKTKQYVTSTWNTTYPDAFVGGDLKPLEDLLRKELLTKLRETSEQQSKAGGSSDQKKKDGDQDQPTPTQPKSTLLEQVWVPPQPNRGGGHHPYGQGQPYQGQPTHPDPFPRIGGGDLDPFNRGGGGMLYDPFNQPGGGIRVPRGDPTYPFLPPGAVPPGARYDPIGPPKGPFKDNRNPNPDHFPPPGGYDPFL